VQQMASRSGAQIFSSTDLPIAPTRNARYSAAIQ